MYGGHGSWAFAIVILVVLAARMLSSRRGYGPGRGGSTRYRGPAGMPWLQGRPRGEPPIDARSEPHGSPATGGRAHTGIDAGWMPDPSGRFEERYWSGAGWTEHVRSGGIPSTDQPPDTTGPAEPDGGTGPSPGATG
jgi:hypothetical protein